MSALFDDAERFDSHIVVGETVRRVKDGTERHVGPGTYSPSMANSKDFGHIGVSISRRSNMDPPTSWRSTEHQRYAIGSVVRDGVWFHTSPSTASEPRPGPGEYSPSVISSGYERGTTAKPSSGVVGRQAWDLRGSAGGAPLSNFRDGFSVSSSMGTTPRMVDFSQVSLRGGVLLLRGAIDGHRANGIGPGEYDGISNRQDAMTKRSYNVRAQNSQLRRERSLSFSGTSSAARAFLSMASAAAHPVIDSASGRPDLHLLGGMGRRSYPRGKDRCMSPASAMLSSTMLSPARSSATAAGNNAAFGMRSGGRSSRSLSPMRSRGRRGYPIRAVGGGWHGTGSGKGSGTGVPRSSFGTHSYNHQQRGGTGGSRSLSPRGGGGTAAFAPRAASLSPHRRQETATAAGAGAFGAPPSPLPSRYGPAATGCDPARPRGRTTGALLSTGGCASNDGFGGGGDGGDASYAFDYFGLAGQRGVWRGLASVSAARAAIGIEEPKKESTGTAHQVKDQQHAIPEGAQGGEGAGAEDAMGGGRGCGSTAARVIGGGGPGSLLPEGAPAKGVCSPPKEIRDSLHTYFDTVNLGSTVGSNLPRPPSPRALRPAST